MKVLILYGSTTGNTEMVAEQIQDNLADLNPDLMDAAEASIEDLDGYDVILAGASTWDDGLLQQDFRDFAQTLQQADPDLSQKKVAIFSLGDTNYPDFCESANILEALFNKLGAQKVGSTLRIDGFPDEAENEDKVDAWSDEIAKEIS
ncbi:MAG: flavodoxin [Candidatus Pacebacteria bacterium]|nr:flavodoxin [Candidatus Paceibacterota bacterium]